MPRRDADTLIRLAGEKLAELKGCVAKFLLARGSSRGHRHDARRLAYAHPIPEAELSGRHPHATRVTSPFLPPRPPNVNCLEPY